MDAGGLVCISRLDDATQWDRKGFPTHKIEVFEESSAGILNWSRNGLEDRKGQCPGDFVAGDGVLRGFLYAGRGLYGLNLPTNGANIQDFLSVCGDVGERVKRDGEH